MIDKLDILGLSTSLLCAIHCAVLPLLLSLGYMGQSLQWLDHPLFELCVALLTSVFVYASLVRGYFKGNVRRHTLFIALFGLLLVIIHHFLGRWTTLAVVSGGLLIALAHFQNILVHHGASRA